MNAQRSDEPSGINLIKACFSATVNYYDSLLRLFILQTCNMSSLIVSTPVSAALFMVMVPTVQYICMRRLSAYVQI